MTPFIKKSLKAFGFLVLILISIELIHFSILATPQKMFSYSLDLGRLKIYSDIHISLDLIQKIIDADERVSQSELYDSSLYANIFICSDPSLYAIFPILTGMSTISSGLTITVVNNVFLNLTRINLLESGSHLRISYSHLNGDFSQILAHELTHQLITDKIGFWEARKFPRWKAEGYCEYNSTIAKIRKDSSYNFAERCSDYFDYGLYGVNKHSKFYYKSQLMVEYLFEVEGISFTEFSSQKINSNNTYTSLKKWYERMIENEKQQ